MAKPKAQTLQQRLGFFDEDLKNPKHDELMLWLDNNIEEIVNEKFNKEYTANDIDSIKATELEKIKSIIQHLEESIKYSKNELSKSDKEKKELPFSLQHTDEELDRIIQEKSKKKEILEQFNIEMSIPSKPRIRRISKKWELPVTTNNYQNKFTIGFIDFVATFNIPILELGGLVSVKTENSFKLKYYDFIEDELKFQFKAVEKTIYVEVKSEIKSLGELIRQINHYKSYINGDYYVMCPDSKYKETLKNQGVNFIDYK